MPGPVPARSGQRRRRNAPSSTLTTGAARPSVPPEPDADWHPMARDWYMAFRTSGQADYFQDTDWQTARVWAQVLSDQLASDSKMSAVMMQSWASANGELLATEGARRRLRLELERTPVAPDGPDEVEDELDAHRRRARKPAGHAAGGSA